MKTVGIITVHHYGNYGSALQAYASQRVFEKLGYDVFIIDYRSPNAYYATGRFMKYEDKDDSFYRRIERRSVNPVTRFIGNVLSEPHIARFLYRRFGVRRGIRLWNFWLDNLRMTRRYDSLKELFADPPHFDIYVVGGDQLWNTFITYNNPAYFLAFADKGAKKISFSTSIGIPHIPDEALPAFRRGIANLSAILLREDEGVKYLQSLGFEAERVLDPTLMLTGNEWLKMQDRHFKLPFEKYVLVYILDPSDWTVELTERVRKQTGLPIIVIGRRKNTVASDGYLYVGNIEVATFITLFANAEIVVTNSFHGMAFTVIFGKVLVATYRSEETDVSMNSRFRNLVGMLNLSHCLYNRSNFSTEKLSLLMDYDRINTLLETYRRQSLDLLKRALSQ